jgi:hypothetical protein
MLKDEIKKKTQKNTLVNDQTRDPGHETRIIS